MKRFLLVNRLVVPGLTAFSKSLCVKSLYAFFLPESNHENLGGLDGWRGRMDNKYFGPCLVTMSWARPPRCQGQTSIFLNFRSFTRRFCQFYYILNSKTTISSNNTFVAVNCRKLLKATEGTTSCNNSVALKQGKCNCNDDLIQRPLKTVTVITHIRKITNSCV